MYCLRQSDGSFVWRFDAEGGIYSSPALDGAGRLYVGSVDSYLYALNSTTGVLAWKFRTNAAVYSSPAIAGGGEGLVYVGSTDWRMYAVRVHDGLLAWNQTLRTAPPQPNATNASNASGPAAAPGESPTNSPPPPPVTPTSGSVMTPPAPGGADTSAAAAKSHARVYPYAAAEKRERDTAAAFLEAEGVCPPNLAQGTDEELSFRFGLNAVLTCGRDTGAVGVIASPVYSPNGLVYVGSSDWYFYALNALTGEVTWLLYTDGPIESSAAIMDNGQLYFATDAGTIYQMDAPYVPPSDVFVDPNDPFGLGGGFG